ncbi:ATP-binding protein [Spirosoma agri]|uniref:histidine kinase n=1 Tax=Spirosoma agri TaxID=1987381 RepID=A0A6M0IRE1_9BACT|nr:ATP-binding protein [Spirosoma agri]NEU70826.1 hypothetical protein [Spirosoma agri]
MPNDSILTALVNQLGRSTLDTTQINLISKLNDRLCAMNQAGLALPWLESATESAQRINKPLYWGRLYYQYGRYYHNLSNYPKAYQAFNKAIPALQQSGNSLEALKAMNYLSLVYGERAEAVKQIEQLNKNLVYAEKTKNYRALSTIYSFLHKIHLDSGDTARASSDLQAILRIARTYNDPGECYLTYSYLADRYEKKGEYAKALPYQQRARLDAQQSSQKDDKPAGSYVIAIWAVANNLFHQGRLQEAERTLAESFKECKRLGLPFFDLGSLLLAQLRERQNRLDEAHHHCQQVISHARKRNPHMVMEGLKVMVSIQKRRGHFQEALTAFQELKLINDSLQRINTHKAIANLEARVELQKQTQHVAILQKDAAIHQREMTHSRQRQLLYGALLLTLLVLALDRRWATKNARKETQHLREVNAVKDKLFSVISHDLRTPVLHLRASTNQLSHPTLESTHFSEQLMRLSRNVNAIYSTLDNLLQWSAFQQDLLVTRPETVDLSELVEQVLVLFEGIIRQKKLTVLRDEEVLRAKVDVVQAQIMIRNILHNAFKFTPVGGEIQISYESGSIESVLSIKDTGIGMDECKPSNAMPTADKGTGLGLLLTREFIKLNNGKLVISSLAGQGTTVRLYFMKPQEETTLTLA